MHAPAQLDATHMARALTLAQRGLGRVWPNPAVGCVIVRENRIVGRGWTQPRGRPHAETMALAQAGEAARGATAYVTLEPCAHHGKTPPCADALISAGIARVVTPMEDPDPRVSGRSIARLRAAGVEVKIGIAKDEAFRTNQGFLTRITSGRPMVTLKLAASLDGRIATASGESQWITGPTSRRNVHLWRAMHDAILVGSGTVVADDPMLNVRGLGLDTCSPVRIVADTRLRTPKDSRLVQSAGDVPVWLAHAPTADPDRRTILESAGVLCIDSPQNSAGHLDLDAFLRALGERGLTRVFCEGGGTLAAALIAGGLVDRLILSTAGKVIGGDGLAAVGPINLAALADAATFKLVSERVEGSDLHAFWDRRKSQDQP